MEATGQHFNKGLAITEIEYMASDPNTSKWLMAGTQDNGTIRFTGATKWDHIADGDGGDCGVDQQNPNTVFHSFYNVTLERSNNKGNSWTWLAPPNVPSLFYPPVEVAGLTVAIGGVSLVVTRNAGPPWATVTLGLDRQRGVDGHARDRRQHASCRHQCRPHAENDLDGLGLEPIGAHVARGEVRQLDRGRPFQPATFLGHEQPGDRRRRPGLPLGQRRRVMGQLHRRTAQHSRSIR